jgi:glycogen(starch) synthase
LRERRVGVVHVQCVSTQADLARRLAKRLRVPLVVTMQGELTMDATGVYQTRAMRRAWRRLLDAADAISGCSQYVLDEARTQHPGLVSSSLAIANGVHANLAPRAHSAPPYVFAVGRLVPQKGFDVLLRALAQTRSPHHLLLAGEGPERPALEQLCQELGLSERVTLLGRQSHDQVLERCASAAAFVLPSRHEPQGIVVLEAMSVGTPVLASAVGGVPETIRHGVNGYLFPNGDDAALAALIERVLGAEHDQTTIAGLRVAEAHRWPHVTARYLELYALAERSLASR